MVASIHASENALHGSACMRSNLSLYQMNHCRWSTNRWGSNPYLLSQTVICPRDGHPTLSMGAQPLQGGEVSSWGCHANRRSMIMCIPLSIVMSARAGYCNAVDDGVVDRLEALEALAREAYGERNFKKAILVLSEMISLDPKNPQLYEMRATALVDGKNFLDALKDFDRCLELLGQVDSLERARVLTQKALALEGLDDFKGAEVLYLESIDLARRYNIPPDPYIQNSLGNCYNSMGKWEEAREWYLASASAFQQSRFTDGIAGRMQRRLDGSIFAFSNAALMLVEIGGHDAQALKEMERIARRAPGSADMRAALAGMYWSLGQEEAAENEWAFACTNIAVGCAKYQDGDWLRRVRRWPPRMVKMLDAFLELRSVTDRVGLPEKQKVFKE